MLALAPGAFAGQAGAPAAAAAEAPTVAAARALLDSGNVDDAVRMLTTLSASATKDVRVDYLLGLAYYRKGDYPRAIDALSASVAGLPPESQEHRDSVQLRGLSHYYLGHLKEAIPDFERVLGWSPENLQLAYALGNAYIQLPDFDRARQTFARVFAVAPDSAQAYVVVAQMLARHDLNAAAEKELEKAIALDPKVPEANLLLGKTAIFRAELDRGVELIRREIAINPANAMAYYWLGEAYSRQQKWDDAVAPLQRSIWLNPYYSGAFIVLGKVSMKRGDVANAVDVLRRAVGMDPNNSQAHFLFGQALQQANLPDEAKREFDEAKRLQAASTNPTP